MRPLSLKFAASAVALALLFLPAWSVSLAQVPTPTSPRYVFIDLTPSGSTTATVAGASGKQQVGSAGFASAVPATTTAPVKHAMLWSGTAAGVVDLGTGTANAIGGGQQVGGANNHAALWSGTAASLVDLNPASWEQSLATGVAGGLQVGWATRYVVCGARKGKCPNGVRLEIHPFMWSGSAASVVDITPLTLGFGAGRALATDGVQQVGFGQEVIGINAFSGPFAVLWSGTSDSAVNLNPPASIESQANGVAGGQQVGFGFLPHRALLWTGTAESVLDMHPDGYASSEANATNGTQQAGFGYVADAANASVSHSHALVWSGSRAGVVDLNQFLPTGYTDAAATGIDATGRVVGWASKGASSDPANVHAVMWAPVAAGAVFAQSLALSQSSVVAGDTVRATVTLSQPAPTGGATVSLSSNVITPTPTTASPITIGMPSAVAVAEGQSSASFDIVTGATTLNGFNNAYLVDIRAEYGGTSPSATLTVNPPLHLSALSVAPNSIAGGNVADATVTLSGVAPAGGAAIALASDSASASVPAGVLIPAGQSSAAFSVKASAVTSATTVTLTATYNGSVPNTVAAKLTITPPAPPTPAPSADVVAIQKAEYVAAKQQLSVQATSTGQGATLTVSITATGKVIGVLGTRGGGRYDGTFNLAANPQNITVSSSLKGKASRAVSVK